jgi:hypothetical protein
VATGFCNGRERRQQPGKNPPGAENWLRADKSESAPETCQAVQGGGVTTVP